MSNTFTAVQHVKDQKYVQDRQRQINECLKMTEPELRQLLKHTINNNKPIADDSNMTAKMLGEMHSSPMVPDSVKTGILDSSSGTTGNVLLRQDLEPILHSIFVKRFPVWERLTKKPSNGLIHQATRITSPDYSSAGSTLITELGSVTYTAGSYDKLTFPIGVFATGRGVSFKEIAAVEAGGSPPAYSPELTEMSNGMVKLAQDLQYFILQGNASNSGGLSTNEGGPYNSSGIDGFRGVLGSYSSFSTNNAIQVDVASLNITESMRFGATKAANNGGNPKLAFMSLNSKQAWDDEQMSNVRWDSSANLKDLTVGTRVNSLTYADGELMIVPFPGTTGGTYNRTSDSALVEDIYLIDDDHVAIPWLYSEGFTVLQIPSGVDGFLSSRWIIFGMFGLEIAAPSFQAKVRRLAS